MNGLESDQLALLHSALEQRKNALLSQLAAQPVGTIQNRMPAVEEIEASPADNASNRTLNQLVQEAAAHTLAQLSIVKHALSKFEDDSYGLCENCGGAIGASRLNARPEARYCIACQTRMEQRRR